MKRSLLRFAAVPVTLLAVACTTVVQQPTEMSAVGPQLSVERFLQVANERDLDGMGRIFGTADGPIGDTGSTFGCAFKKMGSWFGGTPCRTHRDVEIQLDAIARLLQHQDYKVTREERVAGRAAQSWRLFVDLTTEGERVTDVPFVVVRTTDGRWLVENVGLERVMARR